ncbi:CRISPR-associated helicase/endonuclease Cas3 [Actinomadura latina]|uniref:CRISPR-associated helicase/endonuclease Cas3 n=2 Tax=Actinomadura latina TaxID=163603 RepID=A0A846YYD8_9ACTN|nr:CRISPR-associated helicase/endonuclease Cas3 [Actinomadura latina]
MSVILSVWFATFPGVSIEGPVPYTQDPLGVLWGKSAGKAGGQANLLVQHLLDTAAVAELVWDHYLAPSVRRALDGVAGEGGGRRLFAWVCGVHDIGKATPAFQHMDAAGAARVLGAGLAWDQRVVLRYRWRHDRAGGILMLRYLAEAGWAEESVGWVWPLIAGHHGRFPTLGDARENRRAKGQLSGKASGWDAARRQLLDVLTRAVGFRDVADVEPASVPSRALQLQVSGFVVMADWIASDQDHFKGVDALERVNIGGARERAHEAWGRLGLRGGWDELDQRDAGLFRRRFGEAPRPSQTMVMDVAARMDAPGLMVVEAPMGEGKTKAALAAAEILAARWGMGGVFVGMPTQATSDPMFTNVRSWVEAISPSLASQVALLHGKRMFNKQWRKLLEDGGPSPDDRFAGVVEDEFDLDDPYGLSGGACCPETAAERLAPAEWFLGAKRGLLAPFVVGTIDQLLFAATRTKHVMLRMAGLAGKVVVLDEVHAADVYMSQFLAEGLRWLGQAGVPVILLSATLPPAQRSDLVAAYLAGAGDCEHTEISETEMVGEVSGYPNVTAVWRTDSAVEHLIGSCPSWRPDLHVEIEVLPEPVNQAARMSGEMSERDAQVLSLLRERLVDGGCALVIRNTVPRAQETFAALRAEFGEDVRLLHGRLSTADRADRTERCLQLLGPPRQGEAGRPHRMILVATQIAEQSFDVDADLLVTDLAPMDLLLQRIGRIHRHAGVGRPQAVGRPRVVVTGFCPRDAASPEFPPAAEAIYGRYLLLRTAALVSDAAGEHWSIPGQVPQLVAKVYDADHQVVPDAWAETERQARSDWEDRQRTRAESAEPFLLTRAGEHTRPTLEGLHRGGARGDLSQEQHRAVVRDGDRSIEVVLVRRDDHGFRALSGRSLGTNGEASRDVLDDVLGGTVRLPAKLTETAEDALGPLDGWRDHPWLRYSRALPMDSSGVARLGDHLVSYDPFLGLVVRESRG